jgi:Family of unknown function (DUF6325)
MREDVDQMGPIDYLIVEFPGSRLTGEGLPLLVDLVDRHIIRILDFLFVKALPDGSVTALTIGELDNGGGRGLAVFDGASSGLLGSDDLEEIGKVLEPGDSAAVLVYENLWAAPLATALRRAGAQLVASGRIQVQALLAALDAIEETESAPAQPAMKG